MNELRKKMGVGIVAVVITGYLLLGAAAAGQTIEGPAVMVTGYTVEPGVLMPGDTGTVTLTIKNPFLNTQASESETTISSGTTETTSSSISTSGMNAKIETIRLSSSTTEVEWLTAGTQRTEYFNVGALSPGESMMITLPIRAVAYARDGTYFPEVYIEVDNGQNVRFPVRVEVDKSEVQLLEQDIPTEISISESRKIALVVANNRPNMVNGVNIVLRSSSGDFEFTPAGVYVGNLGAYEQQTVEFTLSPLTEGAKTIAFEATYKNGNNAHASALSSSIAVKGSSDVKLILVDAPDSVVKGELAKIDFDVANGMAKDIKAVSVVPMRSGLKLLPSEYFIGDMEVGDVFSASFELHTNDLELGETTIPFKVIFKDVSTDKQYETAGYEVQLEVKEAPKSGLPYPLLLGGIVVLVLLIAALIWLRARRKRARQGQQ
jgi:hypothetical protein